MAKLKVYRTPIGFHDAYVAAPSQKAALAAWGSDANLFARGVAEVVTDPKLTKAPLADPGTVIKVARGTEAEHLAALPRTRRTKADPAPSSGSKRKPARTAPRPSRDKLAAAEAALAELDEEQRAARRELDALEAALRRDRKALEADQRRARAKLGTARDRADDAYAAALARWRE